MSTLSDLRQRAIDIAADYADRLKPHEIGGNNRGFWVAKFLGYVGLGEGYAWCAAFQSFVLKQVPWTKFKSAGVAAWRNWARKNGCIHTEPLEGALCLYVHPNGTGHIGLVESFNGDTVTSIEGNTSPGSVGSQRDGDGVFRRVRNRTIWTHYIYWWEVQ